MFKIPGEPRFFYYEVTICEIHPLTRLSVGLATKPYPYMRLPGIEVNSIAHTGDDGFLHINGSGSKWSAPYAPGRAGATIGCGVSLDANGCPAGVFFTREGVLIAADGFGRAQTLDAAVVGRYSPLMSKQLHVACGATGRAILAFNFGHLPFTWEIANAHMDFGFSTPEFGLPTYDVAMLDGDQTLSGLPAYSA
ncbi:hypothetical protein DFJ74DRAFT_611178 [Hyaloraphidium curvatum]|nr:hypothetical protein DFJ74DRAFT_611178 [Hyaloraphidium curvatum]